MKKTDPAQQRLRFTQPLHDTRTEPRQTRPGATRPFFNTFRDAIHHAGHDMLLMTAHAEFLPDTEPQPDINFFNIDLP